MAGPELLQAEHPHAAAGQLIERRAAGDAESADDDIEMGHIGQLAICRSRCGNLAREARSTP